MSLYNIYLFLLVFCIWNIIIKRIIRKINLPIKKLPMFFKFWAERWINNPSYWFYNDVEQNLHIGHTSFFLNLVIH